MDKNKTISISIIGEPNVGKSSLLNKIIKYRLSIVTPKIQTTRSIITGITTINNIQLILFDTPGLVVNKFGHSSSILAKSMVKCAWSSIHNADVVLLLIDITKPITDQLIQIFNRLKKIQITPIFIFNKVDINDKYNNINKINNALPKYFTNIKIFKVSALYGHNINKLINYLCNIAHIAPWPYNKNDITNLEDSFIASEITREQLFLKLHDELPYNLIVRTDTFDIQNNNSIVIHQSIVVSKNNYKIIIIGKNGNMIKILGINARLAMNDFFKTNVHLFLFVQVRDFNKININDM